MSEYAYLASMGPTSSAQAATTQKHNSQETPKVDTTKDWEVLLDAMKEYDEKLLDGWLKSMNNLLIFAGLFSAVVTAFIIESYSWLQQDPADTSNALLAQISLQLASFSVNSAFINSTSPSASLSPASFQASALNVRINVLWFLSLAMSLIASLFAILVQQWLSCYPIRRPTSIRQGVRVRQLRYESLYGWGVADIINLLPVLLQIALVLFLVGLLSLLWSLNTVVSRVITGFLSVPLVFFTLTAFLPFLSSSCPYRSTITTIIYSFALFVRAVALGTGAVLLGAFLLLIICVVDLIKDVEIGDSIRMVLYPVFPAYLTATTEAFRRMKFREEWVNDDFALVKAEEEHLDLTAVLWSPHALSPDDVPHLYRCLIDLSKQDRAVCLIELVGAELNVYVRLMGVSSASEDLEDRLRERRDTIQLDKQVLERLFGSMLDLLLPWENIDNGVEPEATTTIFVLLRHLIKIAPLAEPHVTRYRALLLSSHFGLVNHDFRTSSDELDAQARIIIRSLFDCLAGGILSVDSIDLAEHDRLVLNLLKTCNTARDPVADEYDSVAVAIAIAFFLHQHSPLSTSEALQSLVAALRNVVQNQRSIIPRNAKYFMDTEDTEGYVPVWPKLVVSLRALTIRPPTNRLSPDAALPVITDLIEVFTGEGDPYFQGMLTILHDLRTYLTGDEHQRLVRTERALERATAAFGVCAELEGAWKFSHVLEVDLREHLRRGTLQPDQENVEQLRVLLLDALRPWENRGWQHDTEANLGSETLIVTFLRHLVKLEASPSASFVADYQSFLLSQHSDLTNLDFGESTFTHDDRARIITRCLLDCWVRKDVSTDSIDLATHDCRALALLNTRGVYETADRHGNELDCKATVLASAFFLHQHSTHSTADALEALVAALQKLLLQSRMAIVPCARLSLDDQRTDGFTPAWPTLVSSLRALAERPTPNRLSHDALLPIVDDLIGVFTGEQGAYFKDVLDQLEDLRGYLTASTANAGSSPTSALRRGYSPR